MPRPFAVLVLVALLGSGACSSDGESASTTSSSGNPVTSSATPGEETGSTVPAAGGEVSDPAELARRVDEGGFGCEDFAEVPATERNEEVDRSGSCTLSSGKTLTIDVLLSRERWDRYVSLAGQGCAFFPGQEVPSVFGRWWSVSVDVGQDGELDPAATRQLAEALDGEYRTTSC